MSFSYGPFTYERACMLAYKIRLDKGLPAEVVGGDSESFYVHLIEYPKGSNNDKGY